MKPRGFFKFPIWQLPQICGRVTLALSTAQVENVSQTHPCEDRDTDNGKF